MGYTWDFLDAEGSSLLRGGGVYTEYIKVMASTAKSYRRF